jgi:hypothetical protein
VLIGPRGTEEREEVERTFHSSGSGSGVPVAGRSAVKLPGSGQTKDVKPTTMYSTVHRQPEVPSFDLTLLLYSVSLNPETHCISYAICDKPQFSGLWFPHEQEIVRCFMQKWNQSAKYFHVAP